MPDHSGYAELVGEDLTHYSAALDEIFRLRRALAYEAGVTEAHLSFSTFPKSRRAAADGQISRMREAARGHTQEAYANVPEWSLASTMQDADASPTLTRWKWEADHA